MRPFRSSQNQCCCCVIAILLPLGSVILTGIGVCVILKYVMVRTDLLLPELQNVNGQKTVGIILTSVGVLGLIISGVIAIIYFTVCNEGRSGQPAVAQKISMNGIEHDAKSPATPKTQANGQNQFHSHPKSPTKLQPTKLKSQFGSSERLDSAKPISVIGGTPLSSTPRRTRGGKNGRPLSSNLDIVKEVDFDSPMPVLQVNGIEIGLHNNCKSADNSNVTNGIILKPILKSSSSAAATATTTTTTNITSTNSITAAPSAAAATATATTKSVSKCLFSEKHIPDSSTNDNRNNNNNNNNNNIITTTTSSASSGTNATQVHSKPHHNSSNTAMDFHESNCYDSNQDLQTHYSDSEIHTTRL